MKDKLSQTRVGPGLEFSKILKFNFWLKSNSLKSHYWDDLHKSGFRFKKKLWAPPMEPFVVI